MRTVLIVEDDPELRELLMLTLHHSGYGVRAAADGMEALADLAAAPADLVLSDVLMPHLDGLQLAAALRAEPETASIPIVLITASWVDPAALASLRAEYVLKPFSMRALLAVIAAQVGTS